MKIKKYIIFLMAVIVCFGFFTPDVSAQDLRTRQVETDYIDVPIATTPEEIEETTIPRYFEYVYYFLVWSSGILALLALIYSGFKYLTSVGDPEKLKNARNGIIAALLGLVIIVGSYVILRTINPNLVVWDLPTLKPLITTIDSGVLACKNTSADNAIGLAWRIRIEYDSTRSRDLSEERLRQMKEDSESLLKIISEECFYVKNSGTITGEFNNQIKVVWFLPDVRFSDHRGNLVYNAHESRGYGAILYDGNEYDGLANVAIGQLFTGGWDPLWFDPTVNVSSIKIFQNASNHTDDWAWKLSLYEKMNYNMGLVDENGSPIPPFFQASHPGGPAWLWGSANPPNNPMPLGGDDPPPVSLKIEGNPLVILFKGEEVSEDGQTGWYLQDFTKNEPNLERYYNIVEWRECKDYEGTEERDWSESGRRFQWIWEATEECAWAAADGLIVLPSIKPIL